MIPWFCCAVPDVADVDEPVDWNELLADVGFSSELVSLVVILD